MTIKQRKKLGKSKWNASKKKDNRKSAKPEKRNIDRKIGKGSWEKSKVKMQKKTQELKEKNKRNNWQGNEENKRENKWKRHEQKERKVKKIWNKYGGEGEIKTKTVKEKRMWKNRREEWSERKN